MSENGEPPIPDGIWPDEDSGAEPPEDDHDYEPHFERVRQSVKELAERLDRVIERCRAVDDPSPGHESVRRRAEQLRARLDRLSDESGVMLGVGHMRLQTKVQLVEIRLRELEEG